MPSRVGPFRPARPPLHPIPGPDALTAQLVPSLGGPSWVNFLATFFLRGAQRGCSRGCSRGSLTALSRLSLLLLFTMFSLSRLALTANSQLGALTAKSGGFSSPAHAAEAPQRVVVSPLVSPLITPCRNTFNAAHFPPPPPAQSQPFPSPRRRESREEPREGPGRWRPDVPGSVGAVGGCHALRFLLFSFKRGGAFFSCTRKFRPCFSS